MFIIRALAGYLSGVLVDRFSMPVLCFWQKNKHAAFWDPGFEPGTSHVQGEPSDLTDNNPSNWWAAMGSNHRVQEHYIPAVFPVKLAAPRY